MPLTGEVSGGGGLGWWWCQKGQLNKIFPLVIFHVLVFDLQIIIIFQVKFQGEDAVDEGGVQKVLTQNVLPVFLLLLQLYRLELIILYCVQSLKLQTCMLQ